MTATEIIQGDMFKLLPEMGENSFDYIFTSPPYNRERNDKYKYYDDSIDYTKMLNFLADQSLRIAKDYVFINVQKNYYNKKQVLDFMGRFSDKIVEVFIWNKTNPMPARGHNITNSYEFVIALSTAHKSLKARSTYTKNVITTSVNSNNTYKKIHKAVMSEDFAKTFFSKFVEPNKRVLDPFSGLATTGLACISNSDDYVGIEVVPEYVKLSRERLNERNAEIALF